MPAMQSLVDQYDDAVEAILADPLVAGDLAHPLVVAYLELFPPDSSFALGTLEFWEGEGAAGRFYRPGPRGVMYVTTIRAVDVQAEDEIAVDVCTSTSVSVVDGVGNPIEAQGGVSGGRIIAVRAGGGWLLRDLTRISAEGCPDPRAGP